MQEVTGGRSSTFAAPGCSTQEGLTHKMAVGCDDPDGKLEVLLLDFCGCGGREHRIIGLRRLEGTSKIIHFLLPAVGW